MTESVESATTVYAGHYQGTMRSMQRCGTITSETQFQGGLRYSAGVESEGRPSRIFFGDQTDSESMKRFAEARMAGIAVDVLVEGYFKLRTDGYGEPSVDTSALFVKNLSFLG